MTKRLLSMILAIVMVLSMFAGITFTVSAETTLTSGEYVIAANVNGTYYAMPNASLSSKPAGAAITVANGEVAAADAADYKVTVTVLENGNITISNGTVYLGYSSSTNFANVDSYEWIPTTQDDGSVLYIANTTADADTKRCITYRTGSTDKFAPYGTTNINGTEYYAVEFIPVASADACTHANATSVVKTAATCTEKGVATWTCPDCNTTWEANIAATGHTYGDGVVTTDPTCTETGVKTYTCTACGNTKTEKVDATGHTYENGSCTVCGAIEPTSKTYTKIDFADITTAHEVIITGTNDTATYALTSANGTSNAPTTVVVTPENDAITTNNTEIIWTIDVSAGTIKVLGEDKYLYVNNSNNGVRVGASGSTFVLDTSGYLSVAINTTTTRYLGIYNNADWRSYTSCTGTSNIANQTFAFYAYKEETTECEHTNTTDVAEVPATCTAAGTTAGVKCSDCGAIISGCETIPAAHSYNDEGVCTVCGATTVMYVRSSTLKNGDQVVFVNAAYNKALSSTYTGYYNTGVDVTTDGGVIYDPDEALIWTVIVNDDGTYSFTHDGKKIGMAASYSSMPLGEVNDTWTIENGPEDGYFYVKNVGRSVYMEWYAANTYWSGFGTIAPGSENLFALQFYTHTPEHTCSYDDGVVTTEAACTANGVKTFTCTCGNTYTETIPALGHNFTEESGDLCARCNAECIKGQKTDALAAGDTILIYNAKSNQILTNTKSGNYLAGVAAIDGTELLRAYPEATVWTVEVVDADAGTYRFKTSEGVYLTSNSYGSFSNSAEISTDKDYSIWKLVNGTYLTNTLTNKTIEYYNNNYTTYKTSTYGEVFELTFFKTNVETFCEHEWAQTGSAEATCTENGSITYECDNCGGSKTEVVPATGHSWGDWTVTTEAGCTTDGEKAHTCANCSTTETETIPATGHSDANADGSCDTCGAAVEVDLYELTNHLCAGDSFVIVAKDADGKYWALLNYEDGTNCVASCKEVTFVESLNAINNPASDVIFVGKENSYSSDDGSWSGIGLKNPDEEKYLHLNASKIRVTSSVQNGIFTINCNEETGTVTIKADQNSKYLTFADGKFATGAEGIDLFIFTKAHTCSYTVAPDAEHTVTAASCTEDGSGYWQCALCDAYAAEATVIPATGHAPVTDAAVPANCTDSGLTEGSHCSVCNEVIVAQQTVNALGHAALTYTDNGDGTHDGTCPTCSTVVEDNVAHEFTDGTCVCGAEEATGIDTALTLNTAYSALALEGATLLRMCVPKTAFANYDIDTAYMEVVATRYNAKTGEYYTETLNIPCGGVYARNYYCFDIENIPAAQLNDELKMTIYVEDADGNVHNGEAITYTAARRAHKYVEDKKGAALEKTMINLLRYAGEFQLYFGYNTANLASDLITEADNEAYPVTEVVLPTDTPETITLAGATVTNTQKSLNIEGVVGIANSFKLPTNADVNNYRLNVSYGDKSVNIPGSEWVYRNTKYGYKTLFDGFAAAQMRTRALFAVYEGDTQVSDAFYYSIADYVATAHSAAAAGNTAAQGMIAAFDAMLNYGDAAAEYFG